MSTEITISQAVKATLQEVAKKPSFEGLTINNQQAKDLFPIVYGERHPQVVTLKGVTEHQGKKPYAVASFVLNANLLSSFVNAQLAQMLLENDANTLTYEASIKPAQKAKLDTDGNKTDVYETIENKWALVLSAKLPKSTVQAPVDDNKKK